MAKYDKSVSTDIHDISRHSVWFSNYTKFQTREIRSWKRKGIVYINDLLKDNGELLSFEEAKIIYKLNGTSLDYLGLLHSLPIEWRNEQSRRKEVNPIIHPNVESILMPKQCNKSIYNILLRKTYRGEKNTWELCWEHELGQIDWVEVYELNEKSISSVYRTLQYKILTKITATNQLLYQIGRKSSYTCDRCETSIDTVTHKFWACHVVKRFWEQVENWLRNKNIIQNISGSVLNKKVVILGHKRLPIVNHVIIVVKKIITNKYALSVDLLSNMLKKDLETERYIAIKTGKMQDWDSKWARMAV